MKTILIIFYNPSDVIDITSDTTDTEIKEYCFRIRHYKDEFSALNAYAETSCLWSTLIDDSNKATIKDFIDDAYTHIKKNDMDWLEQNFT